MQRMRLFFKTGIFVLLLSLCVLTRGEGLQSGSIGIAAATPVEVAAFHNMQVDLQTKTTAGQPGFGLRYRENIWSFWLVSDETMATPDDTSVLFSLEIVGRHEPMQMSGVVDDGYLVIHDQKVLSELAKKLFSSAPQVVVRYYTQGYLSQEEMSRQQEMASEAEEAEEAGSSAKDEIRKQLKSYIFRLEEVAKVIMTSVQDEG